MMAEAETIQEKTKAMRERIVEFIKERWKVQPRGCIISVNRIYNALGSSNSYGGYQGNDSDYHFIAETLDKLGGEYFDKRSQGGLKNNTTKQYVGASKWQFTPKECNTS